MPLAMSIPRVLVMPMAMGVTLRIWYPELLFWDESLANLQNHLPWKIHIIYAMLSHRSSHVFSF